jgi:UDP-N-acetylmuramate--alanine ligase
MDLGYTNIVWVDPTTNDITKRLSIRWMRHITHHGEILPQWWDLVIYSAAAQDAPEVTHAKTIAHLSNKKPTLILSYFWFLGEISKYFTTLAVAWTHGKSTTTALVATTLQKTSHMLWCAILWAWLTQRWWKNSYINTNHSVEIKTIFDHILWKHNQNRYPLLKKYYFVVEACEYKEHFLELDTDYALITNIERDHADYYTTYQQYLQAFTTFIQKVRHTTTMITSSLWYEQIKKTSPTIIWKPEEKFAFTSLIGGHNHTNASGALQLLNQINAWSKEHLEGFSWLRRRSEIVWKTKNGITIISDYAHHPTEIQSTMKWLQERYPNEKITYIFQPHQARRILEFWDGFVNILSSIDSLILYNIYAARENIPQLLATYEKNITKAKEQIYTKEYTPITTHHQLWDLLANTSNCKYLAKPEQLITAIQNLPNNTIVVLMSAWDADFLIRENLEKNTL